MKTVFCKIYNQKEGIFLFVLISVISVGIGKSISFNTLGSLSETKVFANKKTNLCMSMDILICTYRICT